MTLVERGFTPRWSSAPADTVVNVLDDRRVPLGDFIHELGWSQEDFDAFVAGNIEVDDALAGRLSEILGSSPSFWRNRELQYREDRRLVDADLWSKSLPLVYMRGQGQVETEVDWARQASSLLAFFGVHTVDQWRDRYSVLLHTAKLRTSQPTAVDPTSIAVWLRAASQNFQYEIHSWNPSAFQTALTEARRLTRNPNPTEFVPVLQAVCAAAGVRVSVIRAPEKCPVSGAAFLDEGGVRNLVLSGRYLADDHFWYTFFHEAGHLLLHDLDAPFLDELDQHDFLSSEARLEEEADAFATEQIAPGLNPNDFRDGDFRGVVRGAARWGIAPGVLLGQLQHSGRIDFKRMNKLKRRYEWVGTNLESKRI